MSELLPAAQRLDLCKVPVADVLARVQTSLQLELSRTLTVGVAR